MDNIDTLLESTKFAPLSASDSISMKLMLENTERETANLINEGTLSGDVAQFTPILMPLVRRVYPTLIANEILGVQPMTMPTGFIYALTRQYTGDAVISASPNSGAILLDFTLTAGTLTGGVLAKGCVVTGNVTGAVGTVDYVEGTRALIVVTSGTFATTDTAATITQSDGTTASTGTLAVTATYTNEAAFYKILNGYSGSYLTAAAELLGTDMKEVGFTIAKKTVEAKSRALKGQYTVEMYQDLKAQHGLLADEEIMSLMSYEMQAEIDRECVNFVNATAAQLADTTFTASSTDGSGRWAIEKYRTEAIRIAKESVQIGLDTKRGQGNILVVSPKVATMLEQVGTFKIADQASNVKPQVSGGVAGTFDGRYKVVVDQYAVSDYCTVLYKGADRRDALGFFAPYVPMSFTKVTHPDSGQPAVIAKTRYALDTIPGVSSPTSTDRAQTYARSFGVNFTNTVLA
jgi:hypothetical protein